MDSTRTMPIWRATSWCIVGIAPIAKYVRGATMTINWQEWHSEIVLRMQRILTSWGATDIEDYKTLRKAEVEAIAQVKREKHERQSIVH
jgi:hypothetical protein